MATNFIYFDLGNVILNFDHQRANKNVSRLCNVPAADVNRAMFESGLEERFERGALTPDQFANSFFAELNAECDTKDLMDGMSDIFDLNEPVVPLIKKLSECNPQLGILSNTCAAHWDWAMRTYPVITQYFKIRVLSFEVQSMKPELEIYQAAIASANLPAEEIFFVDDRADNVAGAIEAGLDAVLFTSAESLELELVSRNVL